MTAGRDIVYLKKRIQWIGNNTGDAGVKRSTYSWEKHNNQRRPILLPILQQPLKVATNIIQERGISLVGVLAELLGDFWQAGEVSESGGRRTAEMFDNGQSQGGPINSFSCVGNAEKDDSS